MRRPARAGVAALAAAIALLPVGPVAAEGFADHEQVVDLTFPLQQDARYHSGAYSYIDDYRQPRSGGAHRATDIMADAGTPVHAAVGGTVRQVTGMGCGWSNSGALDNPPGWGYAAIVDGDDGRAYWYLHLGQNGGRASEAYASGISCGSRVERGEHIGYVGSSGNASASAPHLHLEIHDVRVADPYGSHRLNPYFSLKDAEARGDFPGSLPREVANPRPDLRLDRLERLEGRERIATAAAVAERLWPDGAGDVVLATARDHADAVAGTALAAGRDAPLLLANREELPSTVRERLEALDPDVVWLLGGERALSPAVQDAVEALGIEQVRRLGGDDRFGTAARIAEVVGAGSGRVALAPGHPTDDTDAWPAGILAGALSTADAPVPLLLTRPDGLPEDTADALAGLDASSAALLAEDGATTADLGQALADTGLEVTLLGGAHRYQLAANVLDQIDARPGPLLLATGSDYPDGLAAGAAAARVGGSLTLVPPTELDDAVDLVSRFGTNAYDGVMTVGGPVAIAERVVTRVYELVAS